MKKLIASLAVAGLGIVGVAAAAAPATARPADPGPNIVSVAITVNSEGAFAGQFDTLLAAATCGYHDGAIVEALTVRGQRTLFAPTDDAFARLGLDASNVCATFAFSGDLLADVLKYHVTNGARDLASEADASRLRMLNSDVVTQAGGVLTDGLDRPANVIVPDVRASNGVTHAIDSVLLPPGFGD